jgi:hypothetical protein
VDAVTLALHASGLPFVGLIFLSLFVCWALIALLGDGQDDESRAEEQARNDSLASDWDELIRG